MNLENPEIKLTGISDMESYSDDRPKGSEVSNEEKLVQVEGELLANASEIDSKSRRIDDTMDKLSRVRESLGILSQSSLVPPSVLAAENTIEQLGRENIALLETKKSIFNKAFALGGLIGALAVGGDKTMAANVDTLTHDNGMGKPVIIEKVGIDGTAKTVESKKALTETGTWAPILVNEISKKAESVNDVPGAMRFVHSSFSDFAHEMNKPSADHSAPYSKTVWGRIGTSDDWRSMAKSCEDLANIYRNIGTKFKIDQSLMDNEIGYLLNFSRGFKEKAQYIDDHAQPNREPLAVADKGDAGKAREAFRYEKMLLVHGYIELPGKAHGGIVPGSEKIINGDVVHTEVRRVYGYNDKSLDTDYISVMLCNSEGKIVAGSAVKKGSAGYDEYYPIAMQFAKELDDSLYKNLFKDKPLESAL